MERVNIASSAQFSNVVPHFLFMHTVSASLHDDFVGFLFIVCIALAVCMLTPAALHDCSISLSYMSDTSSAVQSGNFLMHSVVAQTYRRPGSDGATRSSRSVKTYFVDWPAVIVDSPFCDGGLPAADVPQYWHRADGFMPIFIAHAESRHRCMLVFWHFDTAACVHKTGATAQIIAIKNMLWRFISPSIGLYYIRKVPPVQNFF